MAFSRLSPHDLSTVQTLMGWNQLVQLDLASLGGGYIPLRVTNFNMGSSQTGDAPDYVTGADDRTAWMKGPVTTEGSIEFPYTVPSSGTLSGYDMFAEGANLAENPGNSFQVKCSATNDATNLIEFDNCKIQTVELKGDAEGSLSCSATIWGIAETLLNVSSGDGTATRVELSGLGDPDGSAGGGEGIGKLTTVQIPMWDAVKISGAPDDMFIVGFSLQVENNLKRLYTMGTQDGASPYGLNASSIANNQRKVTGSITWQSNSAASLTSILGAGIGALTIEIGPDTIKTFTLNRCLWTAVPPTVSAGDRITCESSFVAIGSGETAFDALTLG